MMMRGKSRDLRVTAFHWGRRFGTKDGEGVLGRADFVNRARDLKVLAPNEFMND
jgi:hypothetical protein